jgi:hypothetical protein
MTTPAFVQVNPYKGLNPRCWIRLRFSASDGSGHERDLVADTGSPCGIILGQTDFAMLIQAAAAGVNSNFGLLTGGWLSLDTPALGIATQVLSYASDAVVNAVQLDSPDFAGLVGLPVLRMMEYGGDSTAFWVRKSPTVP